MDAGVVVGGVIFAIFVVGAVYWSRKDDPDSKSGTGGSDKDGEPRSPYRRPRF